MKRILLKNKVRNKTENLGLGKVFRCISFRIHGKIHKEVGNPVNIKLHRIPFDIKSYIINA